MRFQVTVQVIHTNEHGWRASTGLPIFIVDSAYQMITNGAGALHVARAIVDPFDVFDQIFIEALDLDNLTITSASFVREKK